MKARGPRPGEEETIKGEPAVACVALPSFGQMQNLTEEETEEERDLSRLHPGEAADSCLSC